MKTDTVRSSRPCVESDPAATALRRAPDDSAGTVAGATASLRRLAFAVTGAADDFMPALLADALDSRIRAAREAGCDDAAAAFDAARRYLARVLEPSPADRSALRSLDRQRLLTAAVRQVYRAHTLVPDTDIHMLRPPADPPDPGLITHPAALIDDLGALCRWSGLGTDALASAARQRGLRIGALELLATRDSRRFPSPTTVEAIAAGCGLSDQQCGAWLAARHRAARALPTAAVPERSSPQAHLDPEHAETPAQLTALLIELKDLREASDRRILHTAQLAGCPVSWSRVWAVTARHEFPTPRVLEAFLIGCGLDTPEREPWMLARKRLAAERRRAGHHARNTSTAHIKARSSFAPPDPCGTHTWAQFSAALRALVRWSGRDLVQIARIAMANGIPVTTDALHYALAHSALPTPSTLDALVVGCGLSRPQQFGWRVVRARLAALPPQTQRLPAYAPRSTPPRMTV